MKKLGFRMMRKHCKIEPLRWYYHCDRIGMVVWQDLVNGGESYDMKRVCYLPTMFSGLTAERAGRLLPPAERASKGARNGWENAKRL